MTEPKDVIAYKEGVVLFREGRVLEALKRFKFAAETGEDRPMEHFALASAYAQVGDLHNARDEYLAFLDMKSGLSQQERAARAAVASIEKKLGQAKQEQKKRQLEEVRKLYDEAVSYYRAGGYPSALERLSRLAEKWGRTPEILNLTGLCHLKLEEYERALDVLQEAAAGPAKHADALVNLSRAWFEYGCRKARDVLDEGVKQFPRSTALLFNRGIVAMASGEWKQAEEAWRHVLALDPEDRLARANLEMVQRRNE